MPDAAPMALAKVMAFMEEMERISDSGEIVGGMHTHLLDFGFHSLMVGRVSGLESPLQNLFASVIETELTDWLQVYRERRYVEVDPAARRLKRSVMPFELREVERESNGDPRAGAVMIGRRERGLANGLIVPVPRRKEGGFVWVGGGQAELISRNKQIIHLLALYGFERIVALGGLDPDRRRTLTEREREVLTWIAAGKSSWEIGEILNIAKRTVDAHAKSAIHKLGAVNRAHAVAIALLDHTIAV